MKTHARNLTLGGIFVPLALVLATLIANEAQALLGLDLERVALAVYLLPFLIGAALAIAALLKLEAARIGGDLGNVLGDLASVLVDSTGAGEETKSATPTGPPFPPPPAGLPPLDPPPSP